MEEDENDLENIFEEYEGDDGPEAANDNEGDNANETQTTERVPVPKRIVKNPRLKFDAERLCGKRGIPVLINHFKDVKFKGKGHEVEDLNKLISTLEHWCHRLYPSMKLNDCLRQIEKLGKKRPVQTCLRKIRLDMPILDSDFVHDEGNNEMDIDIEVPPQDAFDRLINQSQLISTPIADKLISAPLPQVEKTLGTYNSTLTEEQKRRMEYNKLFATERRKTRLASLQSSNLNNGENRLNDSASKEVEIGLEHTYNSANQNEELELDDLVDLVDEDNVVDLVNEDDVVDLVNEDNVVDLVKEDNVVVDLVEEDNVVDLVEEDKIIDLVDKIVDLVNENEIFGK